MRTFFREGLFLIFFLLFELGLKSGPGSPIYSCFSNSKQVCFQNAAVTSQPFC